MLKTEFARPITIGDADELHENKGLALVINDGEIVGVELE